MPANSAEVNQLMPIDFTAREGRRKENKKRENKVLTPTTC